VPELVRLREVMLDAMGLGHDTSWPPGVDRQLRDGLVDDRFFAAVVDADGAPGRLAGGGVGLHYTAEGDPLYRSAGFVEPRQPELRWFGGERQ